MSLSGLATVVLHLVHPTYRFSVWDLTLRRFRFLFIRLQSARLWRRHVALCFVQDSQTLSPRRAPMDDRDEHLSGSRGNVDLLSTSVVTSS